MRSGSIEGFRSNSQLSIRVKFYKYQERNHILLVRYFSQWVCLQRRRVAKCVRVVNEFTHLHSIRLLKMVVIVLVGM